MLKLSLVFFLKIYRNNIYSYLNYLNTKQATGKGSVVKGEGLPSVTGSDYARTQDERKANEFPDMNFLDKNRGIRK